MTNEERGPDARVIFELATDDGWSPVGSERVWAFHLGEDRYRIDNVPWFVLISRWATWCEQTPRLPTPIQCLRSSWSDLTT